jgi:hypothetical protein
MEWHWLMLMLTALVAIAGVLLVVIWWGDAST